MITKDYLAARRERLLAELDKGRRRLETLEHETRETRETLLRIAGAVAVMDELLAEVDGDAERPPAPAARMAAVD